MSLLDGLRFQLRVLLHPRAYGRELEEQVRFHLALEAMQQGAAARASDTDAAAAAAHRAARRRFGNRTFYIEETRRMAGLGFFDVAAQDLRFALRSFRRTPAFTAVAVLTLAIGIGANTAIFSAVSAMLLRPLPYPAPERLMKVSLTRPPRGETPANDDVVWSYPKFVAFREAQTVFADLALWTDYQTTIRGGGEAERDPSEVVGAGYLRVLGVRPLVGRNFDDAEDRQVGGVRSVLIGYDLWQRRFGGDRAVVGRPIDLDGEPYTIVGVLPAGFRGLSGRADLWLPVTSQSAPELNEAWNHSYYQVARLRDGVSAAEAKAAVRQLGARVNEIYPDPDLPSAKHGAIARELDATRVPSLVRQSLLVLLGAVGLVLLIACANVANLFLVRAAGRRREIAVRLAVGAGRRRLVRQLVTESLLLAGAGGALGAALAWVGVRAIAAHDPSRALRLQELGGLGAVNLTTIRLDLPTLAFTAALALGTGLLFGLIPALQATRPDLGIALKEEGERVRVGRLRGVSSRNVLAVAEVALALVLLAGSGLMLRSLRNLLDVPHGFDADHLLTMRFQTRLASPRPPGTPSPAGLVPSTRDSLPAFYDLLLERLAALPGVTAVGLSDCPPLSGGCNGTLIDLRDRPAAPRGLGPEVGIHWINPTWPTAMRIPLVRGRVFGTEDARGRRKAVLVNETAARRFWPGEDPIGKPVGLGQGGFWDDTAYVVGVVGDVRYNTIDSLPGPETYIPYAQSPYGRTMLFIRTAPGLDPASVAPAARRTIHDLAPDFPVYEVRTMADRVREATAYARFSTLLLTVFGALALGLATLGTYGVISFAVSQRTREVGIRVALGATRGDVVRLVLGHGSVIALAGVAIGMAGAVSATRVLRSFLYGVAPTDGPTLATIVLVLACSVLAASWLPARRAASVSPTRAIRGD